MSETRVSACSVGEIMNDPRSAALFEQYSRECANPLLGPASPEREMYEAMGASGFAKYFAAYVDGVLCGFAVVLTAMMPHYGRIGATVESLFVMREARGSNLGVMLMAEVEGYAREAGCEVVFYSAPVKSRLARLLFLSSDDYSNTNHIFAKRLQ